MNKEIPKHKLTRQELHLHVTVNSPGKFQLQHVLQKLPCLSLRENFCEMNATRNEEGGISTKE